jgi:hypothetical protein
VLNYGDDGGLSFSIFLLKNFIEFTTILAYILTKSQQGSSDFVGVWNIVEPGSSKVVVLQTAKINNHHAKRN